MLKILSAYLACLAVLCGRPSAAVAPKTTVKDFVNILAETPIRKFGFCIESLWGSQKVFSAFDFEGLKPLSERTAAEVSAALNRSGYSSKVIGNVVLLTDRDLLDVKDNPIDQKISALDVSGDFTAVVSQIVMHAYGIAGPVAEKDSVRTALGREPLRLRTVGGESMRDLLLIIAQERRIDWSVEVVPVSMKPANVTFTVPTRGAFTAMAISTYETPLK